MQPLGELRIVLSSPRSTSSPPETTTFLADRYDTNWNDAIETSSTPTTPPPEPAVREIFQLRAIASTMTYLLRMP